MKFNYPKARQTDASETYHEKHKIDNKFDWTENPDSEETIQFCEDQNKVTNEFLHQYPKRAEMKANFEKANDYEKYGLPFRASKHCSKFYFYHNSGLQNQYVLYQADSDKTDVKDAFPILDPNLMSEDGTISTGSINFSPDGKIMAYSVSKSGSDWKSIHFRSTIKDETTGKFNDLTDTLERVKYSSEDWSEDGQGLFYCSYPQQEGKTDGTETTAATGQKLHYHRLGESQENDQLIYENNDEPEWMFGCELSSDGRYLFRSIQKGCERSNMFHFARLSEDLSIPKNSSEIIWIPIADKFSAQYDYVYNIGSTCYVQTDENEASNMKIVKIDLNDDKIGEKCGSFTDHVSEDAENVLSGSRISNEKFLILNYLQDCKDVIKIFELESGKFIQDVQFDDMGSIGWSCRKYTKDVYFKLTGFVNPGSAFKFNIETKNMELLRQTIVSGFDASKYKTSQVFYKSKDGTKVPMFIVSSRDVVLDGTNPTILYAYGGFNVSITPYFSAYRPTWVGKMNGILAIANIRGGGEYGKKWHDGGKLMNNMNCYDDFHAGAEYLISEKYTAPEKLAIQGGSNGGLLVATSFNQRPDLYRAVLCHCPVIDMLRFQRYTIGHAWKSDFGSPDDNEEDFLYNLKYSPLHNVRKIEDGNVKVPGIMVLTADHDDRVVPHHSLKFAAEIQNVHGESAENPLLLRVEMKAGHGAGKPISKVIDEQVDVYSFLALMMGIK